MMPATTTTLLDSISPGALTAIDKAKIGAAGIYEEADIEAVAIFLHCTETRADGHLQEPYLAG